MEYLTLLKIYNQNVVIFFSKNTKLILVFLINKLNWHISWIFNIYFWGFRWYWTML